MTDEQKEAAKVYQKIYDNAMQKAYARLPMIPPGDPIEAIAYNITIEGAKEEAAERAGDYAYHCAKALEQLEIIDEIENGG